MFTQLFITFTLSFSRGISDLPINQRNKNGSSQKIKKEKENLKIFIVNIGYGCFMSITPIEINVNIKYLMNKQLNVSTLIICPKIRIDKYQYNIYTLDY